MLRTATRPRALALLALALAVATLFAWLGDWQLQRSREESDARADQQQRGEQPARDLLEVLPPATGLTGGVVGATVTVSGQYDVADELLVTGKDGGTWVLTPLVVETEDGEARLPVVRGVLPAGEADVAGADVPAPPTGTVELTGRIEAGDPPVGLPPGASATRVDGVSPADLANLWGPPVWTGYVALTDPAPRPPLTALPEPDRGGGGLALQNLSYALQWWVFAAFAVFVWWRLVRETHLRSQEQDAGDRGGDQGDRGGDQESDRDAGPGGAAGGVEVGGDGGPGPARGAAEREDGPVPRRDDQVSGHDTAVRP